MNIDDRALSRDAAGHQREDHSPEVIAIHGTEAYVWTPYGVRAMTLSYAYLEMRFDVAATARNWNTLAKIVAKL